MENSFMKTYRQTWKVLGAGLLTVAVSACGGSSKPAASTSSPTSAVTPTSPATTSPAATSPSTTSPVPSGAVAAITTNWETFFNIKTSVAKRVALLQDGSQFSSIIAAQQHSPLAAGLTAKVTSVSNVTATQAQVKYNLIVSGAPVPMNPGTAVYENGTWKVGAATFCGLLNLEQLKNLPAVCTSAG
jgi:hypothetical protein